MLEFITQNSPLLGIMTIAIAGLFGFIKWLDTRNNELKDKRYKTYMNLISVISGKRDDGSSTSLAEQIAATWFLLEYAEYYNMTRKIFENNNFKEMADERWVNHVFPHIEKLLIEIS